MKVKFGVENKSKLQAEQLEAKAIFPRGANNKSRLTDADRLHRFLAEVSVGEHQRGHQGPQVEGQAQPAGADLHPDRWYGGLHGLIVGLRPDEPGTVRGSSVFEESQSV